MSFQPNPHLDAELAAMFDRADEALAGEFKAFLQEKLAGAGGGVHHPGLPNPSSLPGEYPAEQSGALLRSIDAQRGPGGWEVGSFDAPPEAWALEYPSPPDGPIPRESERGARPWLSKALTDPELLERLLRALEVLP